MKSDRAETYFRPAAFAGPVHAGFYPSDPRQLRKEIEYYLAQAEPAGVAGTIWGLVAPHAGYVYSGPVAGWAYRQVVGEKYDAVILLAPSHREPFRFASVMTRGAYATPLGDLKVDGELAEELIAAAGKSAAASLKGHTTSGALTGEHSLEVQLPFLQVALGGIPIVPVVFGWVGWETCRNLGQALAEVSARRRLLVVASSDLSHYHSYDEAYKLDRRVIALIEALDAEGLAEGCRDGKLEACGGMPIASLLAAGTGLGSAGVKILRHKNSGDVPEGGKAQVVGYLAAAVYLPARETQSSSSATSQSLPRAVASEIQPISGSGLTLTVAEKLTLLKLARDAIAAALAKPPRTKAGAKVLSLNSVWEGNLGEKRGVFVTLHSHSRLRGCIGRLQPEEPLGELVGEVAVQSAFSDPRFPPLSRNELDSLKIEITVLGDMMEARANEVLPGKHGLLIRKGWQQGLLLPQVAVEQGWNREQFLDATCRKAGLPNGCWREMGTKIFIFTADLF